MRAAELSTKVCCDQANLLQCFAYLCIFGSLRHVQEQKSVCTTFDAGNHTGTAAEQNIAKQPALSSSLAGLVAWLWQYVVYTPPSGKAEHGILLEPHVTDTPATSLHVSRSRISIDYAACSLQATKVREVVRAATGRDARAWLRSFLALGASTLLCRSTTVQTMDPSTRLCAAAGAVLTVVHLLVVYGCWTKHYFRLLSTDRTARQDLVIPRLKAEVVMLKIMLGANEAYSAISVHRPSRRTMSTDFTVALNAACGTAAEVAEGTCRRAAAIAGVMQRQYRLCEYVVWGYWVFATRATSLHLLYTAGWATPSYAAGAITFLVEAPL